MLNAWFQDRTDLWRHLCEQVVVCSKRTQVHTLADGGWQRLDLIEAAVELIQSRESTEKDMHVKCEVVISYSNSTAPYWCNIWMCYIRNHVSSLKHQTVLASIQMVLWSTTLILCLLTIWRQTLCSSSMTNMQVCWINYKTKDQGWISGFWIRFSFLWNKWLRNC